MALPGFTADASLGPTVNTYRVQHDGIDGSDHLSPQQLDDEGDSDESYHAADGGEDSDPGSDNEDETSEGAEDDEESDVG